MGVGVKEERSGSCLRVVVEKAEAFLKSVSILLIALFIPWE